MNSKSEIYQKYIEVQYPLALAYFSKFQTPTTWTAERMARHSLTISGSKIGSIVGDCRWHTSLDTFLAMTLQKEPFAGNTKTRRGQALEHEIAYEASEILHGELGGGLELVHPDASWLTCQIDETMKNSTLGVFLVECKWISFPTKDWGKGSIIDAGGNIIEEDSQIPQDYFDQVQWQLGIINAVYKDKAPKLAILSAVIKNEPLPRIYAIHFDEALFNELKEKAETFLFENVIKKVAPDMTEAELQQLEEATNKKKKTVDGDFLDLNGNKAEKEIFETAMKYSSLTAQINDLKKEQEEIKQTLIREIGEHEGVMAYGTVIATYKTAKDKIKFNEKLFAEKNPELYEQYCETVKGSRIFSNKI